MVSLLLGQTVGFGASWAAGRPCCCRANTPCWARHGKCSRPMCSLTSNSTWLINDTIKLFQRFVWVATKRLFMQRKKFFRLSIKNAWKTPRAPDAEEHEMLRVPIRKAVKLPNPSKTLWEWVTRTVTMVKSGKQSHVYHQNEKGNYKLVFLNDILNHSESWISHSLLKSL